MAKINIEYRHEFTDDEIRIRVASLAEKLGDKYGILTTWSSKNKALLSRTNCKGSVIILDKLVSIDMNLSSAISPLKGNIQQFIENELKMNQNNLPKKSEQHKFKCAKLSDLDLPVLVCTCGFKGCALNWEKAGWEFDEHLYDANEGNS